MPSAISIKTKLHQICIYSYLSTLLINHILLIIAIFYKKQNQLDVLNHKYKTIEILIYSQLLFVYSGALLQLFLRPYTSIFLTTILSHFNIVFQLEYQKFNTSKSRGVGG